MKRSVILTDRLGPDILLVLTMKRQVLHRERAHLKVPGCSLVLSALLTKKLPTFSRICKFLLMVQKITRTSLFSFTSAKISLQTFPAKTFKARLEERGLPFNSSRVLVNKPNPARKFVPFRVKTNNPAVSNLRAIPTGNSSFY